MKCRILAFGVTREIMGKREVDFEFPEGKNIGELKALLFGQHPRLEALKSMFIAVNKEYAADHVLVKDNDEIALIPPVAGG